VGTEGGRLDGAGWTGADGRGANPMNALSSSSSSSSSTVMVTRRVEADEDEGARTRGLGGERRTGVDG
jgi:hypothetical protein